MLCIVVFLVVDIFICPVMFGPTPDFPGKVVLGMFIAQAGLLASLGGFGTVSVGSSHCGSQPVGIGLAGDDGFVVCGL